MKSMGGLGGLMDKLPGMGNMAQMAQQNLDMKMFARMEVMINSMTPRERRNPDLIQGATSDIYVLDLETDAVRRVVDSPGPDSSPRWSPDGRMLVFSSAESKRRVRNAPSAASRHAPRVHAAWACACARRGRAVSTSLAGPKC